jgi:hypothetical protein
MHPELDHQKGPVMEIPRRSVIHLCQSSMPFSPCGRLASPERRLGFDIAAFSLFQAIRLARAAK